MIQTLKITPKNQDCPRKSLFRLSASFCKRDDHFSKTPNFL